MLFEGLDLDGGWPVRLDPITIEAKGNGGVLRPIRCRPLTIAAMISSSGRQTSPGPCRPLAGEGRFANGEEHGEFARTSAKECRQLTREGRVGFQSNQPPTMWA
jgi:hypothetical protein